jgi:lipopolysaccharide export system protein LptA
MHASSVRHALAALTLACAFSAQAERADRDRPVNIEADRMDADDAQKTAVFEGHVMLTQGTLRIRADRITVRQDSDGFQYGIALGKPATFRQKREAVDDYVEAEAERIEYDGRAERVQLFNRAQLRRDGGDDIRGNYISYDSKTERFTVQAAKDAPAQTGGDRVRAVIMPKVKAGSAAGPATPLELKPAPAITNPRQD